MAQGLLIDPPPTAAHCPEDDGDDCDSGLPLF
jgi:hypothetical protein